MNIKILSVYKIITCLNKFITLEEFQCQDNLNPDLFMVSTGISDKNFNNLKKILSIVDCNWICIDIANGYISSFVDFCLKVRKEFPDKIIVAGNVASREMVEELIIRGKVDIVKIGIGGISVSLLCPKLVCT